MDIMRDAIVLLCTYKRTQYDICILLLSRRPTPRLHNARLTKLASECPIVAPEPNMVKRLLPCSSHVGHDLRTRSSSSRNPISAALHE